jgi:hypothetical protein
MDKKYEIIKDKEKGRKREKITKKKKIGGRMKKINGREVKKKRMEVDRGSFFLPHSRRPERRHGTADTPPLHPRSIRRSPAHGTTAGEQSPQVLYEQFPHK